MKILLINGSPKGKRSNSLKLAQSFVDGYVEEAGKSGEEIEVDELCLSKLNIAPCKGCFGCWKATPGSCVIKDDMAQVIEKKINADLVVWSFPLYFFTVPGTLKNMIDRQLPMVLPFMDERTDGYGSGSHSSRYKNKKTRNVVISTCGFWSAEGNYDGVTAVFDHFLGKGNFESIFCGQGELFGVAELADRTGEYLAAVKAAGSEYASGGITDATREELEQTLFPKEVFEAMADASWGVERETGEKEPADLVLTRQMAALYNKAAYDGKDRVLEMNYTDLGTSYQILLGKDGSKFVTDGSLTTTTRINTPFDVWAKISKGELKATQVMGDMYTVDGDFSLMTSWNKYFGAAGAGKAGGKKPVAEEKDSLRPPKMLTMLIPWIVFWVAVSIDAVTGSIITLAATALTPVYMGYIRKHQIVKWDWLSMLMVTVLSLVAHFTDQGDIVTTVGYLIFGLMWLFSCRTKEPLCATYVKYQYGGDAAFENKMFMKTNAILAACWGALYVLTAVWTFALRQVGVGDIVVIVNNVVPLAMGAFTVWFQKWYPAHLAQGGSKR